MVQPGVLDRLTVTDTVRLLADLCALNVTNECVAAGCVVMVFDGSVVGFAGGLGFAGVSRLCCRPAWCVPLGSQRPMGQRPQFAIATNPHQRSVSWHSLTPQT